MTGEPIRMWAGLDRNDLQRPKSGQFSNYALNATLYVTATKGGKTGIGRAPPSVTLIMSVASTPCQILLIINYLTKLIVFEILGEKRNLAFSNFIWLLS